MIENLLNNPDPRWINWVTWARENNYQLPANSDFYRAGTRVWAASDYVANTIAHTPEILIDLISTGDLQRADYLNLLAARVEKILTGITTEFNLQQALRNLRKREMIRIIWRDLAGWASLTETLEDLSELAEQCVRTALNYLFNWMSATLGTPRDSLGQPMQLIVLAMGKLGARELNLSSDIDLIFAFNQDGEIQDHPRHLSHSEFFIRLSQKLIQTLANITADGLVFRVDTRLRPFGESGPLALSFTALEAYYQAQAREWERYAMIKARPIAGSPADCEQLIDLLHPFVYRRYLDFGAFESLRELKHLIIQEVKRHGMEDNIKLGPGGIREIEFIGQVFQLIRGGRDPDLQTRSIQKILAQLEIKNLLPKSTVQQLNQAYVFLRQVENRLQAYRDQQTHQLPNQSDHAGCLRLAHAMDFDNWQDFKIKLNQHRSCVQEHFDQIFAGPEPTTTRADEFGLSALWSEPISQTNAQARLIQAGFLEPESIWVNLIKFKEIIERKGISSRGRACLNILMPLLLQASIDCKQPDAGFTRILTIFEAIIGRTAYFAMLAEHPPLLTQLTRLVALSPWITEQIARHPILLDELLDHRRFYTPLRKSDLTRELESLLSRIKNSDLEQQMERLRQFAQSNRLRVAAADLTGVISLMTVSDYLTEIAEVILEQILNLAFIYLKQQHGQPTDISGETTGLLILGYGKLGGIELGYGSDLDLVLLHGSNKNDTMTAGTKRQISNEQFYVRLGQRMIHFLTTQMPAGILYPVDLRLRPDGRKGMLVRSLTAFANYQQQEAWTWEHQALIRARPVAGEPQLAQKFSELRHEILCRPRNSEQLRIEIIAMRNKMRLNLDHSRAGQFDLKQGLGGIADLEFLVQYAVLRWAAEYPVLTQWTDNIRILTTLAQQQIFPTQASEELIAAYQALRSAAHRNALQTSNNIIPDDQLRFERERVRWWWKIFLEKI